MSALDLSVIVVYLLGMAGMGFFFMRRNKDANAYFKAGGNLPWWVVSLSIYATMFSSSQNFAIRFRQETGIVATLGRRGGTSREPTNPIRHRLPAALTKRGKKEYNTRRIYRWGRVPSRGNQKEKVQNGYQGWY